MQPPPPAVTLNLLTRSSSSQGQKLCHDSADSLPRELSSAGMMTRMLPGRYAAEDHGTDLQQDCPPGKTQFTIISLID